jgi:hypothetical protein
MDFLRKSPQKYGTYLGRNRKNMGLIWEEIAKIRGLFGKKSQKYGTYLGRNRKNMGLLGE